MSKLKDLLRVILYFVLMILGTVISVLIFEEIFKINFSYVNKNIMYLCVEIFLIIILYKRFKPKFIINMSRKEIFKITIITISLSILSIIFLNIYDMFFKFNVSNNWFDKNNIIGTILFVVILGPISEELFFRGLIFDTLSNSFSYRLNVLVTSALFGFLHLNLACFFYTFIFAIYLSHIKNKNGIIFSIYSHMLFNLISFLLLYCKTL